MNWEPSISDFNRLTEERDRLSARLEHAENILSKISSEYWRVSLNDLADGWRPGDEVCGYWQTSHVKHLPPNGTYKSWKDAMMAAEPEKGGAK